MLDAANILMNNYQIVAARTQTLNPTPSATRPAGATEAVSANALSTSATVSATVSGKTNNDTNNKEELPTTSAAAAAALLKTSPKAEVTDNTTIDTSVAKHNQVTIEDLGGEDHIDAPASTSSLQSATDVTSTTTPATTIDSTSEHMNELRKRRLKFLEERNKTSTD